MRLVNIYKIKTLFTFFLILSVCSIVKSDDAIFNENFYEYFYQDTEYSNQRDQSLTPYTTEKYSGIISNPYISGNQDINPYNFFDANGQGFEGQVGYDPNANTSNSSSSSSSGSNQGQSNGSQNNTGNSSNSGSTNDNSSSGNGSSNGGSSGGGGGSSGNGGSFGSGGGSSGGDGGSSGGGGSVENAATCRNMNESRIQARLNQVSSILDTSSPNDTSLIYEKGMLLFCLGDFKKSGLELAKIYAIDPSKTASFLNSTDSNIVLSRFQKVLDNYKASPLNPNILDMANKVKTAIEQKNQITDEYVNQLNTGYSYTTSSGELNYEAEIDKIYTIYRSQDMLQSDLAQIYDSNVANDIVKSREITTGAGAILQ